jgi:hypothetical protein
LKGVAACMLLVPHDPHNKPKLLTLFSFFATQP